MRIDQHDSHGAVVGEIAKALDAFQTAGTISGGQKV
jgi:hypothetical protein